MDLDILQKHIVDEVSFKWKEIATALGCYPNKIETVNANHVKTGDSMLKILTDWLRESKGTGDKPRTLKTLYDVLIDRDCREEAERMLQAVAERGELIKD